MAGCAEAVRRAAEVLGDIGSVAWVSVRPGYADTTTPWVYVTVEDPAAVHALAALEADAGVFPAFHDGGGRLNPNWVGWVNGIRLHVEVAPEGRPAS